MKPLLAVVCLGALVVADSQAPLTGSAADRYRQAEKGKFFGEANTLRPDVLPSSDGRSFLVAWKASSKPSRWIVSLHGTQGFATDDLGIWHPNVKGRDVGLHPCFSRYPLVALAAPSAGSAAAVPGMDAASGEQIYSVKSGDTLTGIAHDKHVTIKALRSANDLKTDRLQKKLVVQRWNWIGRAKSRTHRQQVEAALHRFEEFQLGRS